MCHLAKQNKKDGKEQETIQSSTTPDPGYHMVKQQKIQDKQGKFVEFISLAKGYSRETYKSQNINPMLTLGIIQIKVKSPSTSFQY